MWQSLARHGKRVEVLIPPSELASSCEGGRSGSKILFDAFNWPSPWILARGGGLLVFQGFDLAVTGDWRFFRDVIDRFCVDSHSLAIYFSLKTLLISVALPKGRRPGRCTGSHASTPTPTAFRRQPSESFALRIVCTFSAQETVCEIFLPQHSPATPPSKPSFQDVDNSLWSINGGAT